jgi:hypothetical protein
MMTAMMKHFGSKLALILPLVTLFGTGACSDQGVAKKPDPPKAATTTATPTAPPLASGHAGDGGTLPPGHPPIDAGASAPPTLPPVSETAGTGDAALAWTVPAGWTSEAPASPMRRAQYKVPGAAGDGECVVFYFGPGQGGDPKSNADRWAEQFTLANGKSGLSAMTTSEVEAGGAKVLIVEVAGTYKGGMTMTAAPAVAKPGYRLLGAVAPGPDANWFFKFTGPDKTVTDQRGAFLGMVKSLKRGGS